MTKDDHVVDIARRANPVAPDAFEELAGSAELEDVLVRIMAGTERDSGTSGSRASEAVPAPARRGISRRRLAGLIAAATLIGTGAAVAAINRSSPDPEQAAQVERDFRGVAEAHLNGWRPELAAEEVVCLFPGTRDALVTFASDFPLADRLTAEDLTAACASAPTDLAGGDYAGSSGTRCVTERGPYPKAVVGMGGVDCSDARWTSLVGSDGSARAVETRPITADDLRVLNWMRTVEVAVLAVPADGGCPTVEEATDWAKAKLDELGVGDLDFRSSDETDGCYRGTVSWNTGPSPDRGEVWIRRLGDQL